MKKSYLMGALALGIFGTLFVGSQESSAAEVLRGTLDLKGGTTTIVTENGVNILKKGLKKYELTEESVIYSSCALTVNLNNTLPVNIDSIYTKSSLYINGNGELNADTKTGQFGINVGGYFKPFYCSGKGKITAKGNEAGIRVHNEIRMKAGTVEAYGTNYGIWCNNDIKPFLSSVLKGTATEGTGIWAYRDIYAWTGATVVGEGKVSGARSAIAHIQAEGKGSSITGISNDINSGVSALQADRKMLRAYCGAVVREEYRKPTFEISFDTPVFVTDYKTVKRNMNNMKNYTWTSEPGGVYLNNQGGLLADPAQGSPSSMRVVGTRQAKNCCIVNYGVKCEPTQLKYAGVHQVIFSEAPTAFTVKVTVNYWIDVDGSGNYQLKSQELEYALGDTVSIEELKANHPFAGDASYVDGSHTADFAVTEDTTIDFYFEGDAALKK